MSISDLIVEDLAYSAARRGAEEFLRPKNALERLFLVSVVLYIVFAVFPAKEFRLLVFILMVIAAILSWVQVYISEKQVKSLFSTSFKLLIAVFLVLTIFPNTDYTDTVFSAGFTFIQIEKYLAGGLLLIGVFFTAIKIEKLDRDSLASYNLFLIQLINGIWRVGVMLCILMPSDWFPTQIDTVILELKLIFVAVVIISMFGALIPRKKVSTLSRESLSLDTLLMGQTNTYSRLRDTMLVNIGIVILLFVIPGVLSESDKTLIGQVAFLMFVGIIAIMVMEPSDKRKARGKVSDTLQGYGGKLNKQATSKVNEMKSRFDNIDYKKPEDVFVLPKTDSILKKDTIDFQPEKGSVIIPVEESEEGATVVVVGKGNIEVEDASGEKKVKEFEGSTTMLLSPEEWIDLKNNKLVKSKIDNIDVKNLPIKMENIDQLTNNVSSAIDRLKKWKGPSSMIEEEMSNLAKPSSYGVMETKDATVVNFPGLKVYDIKGMTAVQMPFLQVLESKKGTLVSMPFLKVIERGDYTYVSLPGFQILDTKNEGEIVKVFGMRFGSGSTKKLEDVMRKIPQDTRLLESHFADRLSNIITDEGTDFLLTESTDGEILQITAGDRDSVIEEIGPNGVTKPEAIDYYDEKVSTGKEEKKKSKTAGVRTKTKTIGFQIGNKPKKRDGPPPPPKSRADHKRQRKIRKLEKQIEQLDDRLLEGKISEETHEKMFERLQAQLESLKKENDG